MEKLEVYRRSLTADLLFCVLVAREVLGELSRFVKEQDVLHRELAYEVFSEVLLLRSVPIFNQDFFEFQLSVANLLLVESTRSPHMSPAALLHAVAVATSYEHRAFGEAYRFVHR